MCASEHDRAPQRRSGVGGQVGRADYALERHSPRLRLPRAVGQDRFRGLPKRVQGAQYLPGPGVERERLKIIDKVEKVEVVVVYAMIAMLLVAIILGTLALGRLLFGIVVRPPLMMMIEPAELFASFGMFLIIVIGLELLKVLKLHLSQGKLRPELVIEVAMIAVCNKVVTLDPKAMTADTLLGLAALLLGLAAGYFVFVRARAEDH